MKFLDCTLRDGGYYTRWDFEDDFVKTYLETVNELPIDFIELGYRSRPMETYFGQYFYCPEFVFDLATKYAPNKKFCIIIDEKNTLPHEIQNLIDPIKDKISMVRIAVAPEKIQNALELSEEIKKYNLHVSLNIMYLSKWGDQMELAVHGARINQIVDAFYLVDSFGGVLPEELIEKIKNVKEHISVPLGFHGHNNMELALANSILAMDMGVEYIDATFMGMGRGAGNLKTELFLSYLYGKKGQSIDFRKTTRLLDLMGQLMTKHQWGTQLPYMMSGVLSIPQKEIMDWLGTRRYSLGSIINAIGNKDSNRPDNIKLPIFTEQKSFEKCVIVGGASSSSQHLNALKKFVQKTGACIIHSTYRHARLFLNWNVDQYYCMAGSETERMTNSGESLKKSQGKFIFPPYPRKMGTMIPKEIEKDCFEVEKLSNLPDLDSPLSLALATALRLGIEQVFLIGFDGYLDTEKVAIDKFRITHENQEIIDGFNKILLQPIHTLTPSNYKNLIDSSVYKLISNL